METGGERDWGLTTIGTTRTKRKARNERKARMPESKTFGDGGTLATEGLAADTASTGAESKYNNHELREIKKRRHESNVDIHILVVILCEGTGAE